MIDKKVKIGLIMLRVGVDVGGTNTDAVVVSGSAAHARVLGFAKRLTTENPFDGVREAVLAAIESAAVGEWGVIVGIKTPKDKVCGTMLSEE